LSQVGHLCFYNFDLTFLQGDYMFVLRGVFLQSLRGGSTLVKVFFRGKFSYKRCASIFVL